MPIYKLLRASRFLVCGTEFVLVFASGGNLSGRVVAQDTARAKALLRGAAEARLRSNSIRVEVELGYPDVATPYVNSCLLEMDGARRRIDQSPPPFVNHSIIMDGDVLTSFRRTAHEDVQIYDLSEATGTRGDVIFDPRVIGLEDDPHCSLAVNVCFWYENVDSMAIVGVEKRGDVEVCKIRVNRSAWNSTREYWIDESEFRVHRLITDLEGFHLDIVSEFTDPRIPAPFPSRVTTRREVAGQIPDRREFVVKSLELDAKIDPERFTLQTMDLTPNTPVVDYRISRIIGYWNGEGISEHPIPTKVQDATPPRPPERESAQNIRTRIWLITINVLVVAGFVGLFWWRRKSV